MRKKKIKIKRVSYGQETRVNFSENCLTCHDCGVKIGEYHKKGCDVEECYYSHLQKITCCPDLS